MASKAPSKSNIEEHPSDEEPQHDENEEVFDDELQSETEDGDDEVEGDNFLPIEYDVDAWDDTALIEAYERAVQSYNGDTDAKNAQEIDTQKSRHGHSKPNSSVMIATAEPSRKRRASIPVPQASAQHVRVPKRSRRTHGREDPQYPSSRTDGEHTDVLEADKNIKMMIPPPPPPVLNGQPLSKELEQLLKSWYEAGYRAGLYIGRHSDRR